MFISTIQEECMVHFILPWNDVFFIWTINELYYTFIWVLSSHSRVSDSCGDVTIDCEGLRILAYTLHSPSINKGSLVCHAYSDTGFVNLRRPVTYLLPNVWQQSCHYMFTDSSLSRPIISRMQGERCTNSFYMSSSLLKIYPVADGWTIRKWYNYLHVCLQESGNKVQPRSLFVISNYHATAAVAQW